MNIVEPKRRGGIRVVLAIVALDFAGIGLTLPIIPRLLSDVAHTTDLGWRFGAFLSLYALMQFVFSPILGSWSDRIGRRPVLLFSLAGATVDYVLMAVAPWLALLFLGRAIAGITGASQAVAFAYITDVTPEDERAQGFGLLNACQGLGFIAGPLLGGILGEYWVRAPFIAAALLNAITFFVTLWILREPRRELPARRLDVPLNPFAAFRWAFSLPGLLSLLLIFVVISLIGQVGGTIWIIYGTDRYGWSPFMLGLSIACFGLLHALAQAFIAGPLAKRWGERTAILIGVITDASASVLIAFASRGWMPFALMPLFCLGAVGLPALQSLLAKQVDAQSQGKLQGVLASLLSLTSIVGPVAISDVYFATRAAFPGLVWLVGAALYLFTLPILVKLRRDALFVTLP
jgi:DHA1 family tetracycline resistance protein-like MFS transporter